MATVRIYPGDCRQVLAKLDEESVHCVVTSPPYYGVRDYMVAGSTWSDGWYGALGLEPSVEMYVDHIVQVFRAVRRVLRKDGTVWVNMGDGYVSAPPGNKGKYNPETDRDGVYSRRGNRQLGHGEDMKAIYVKHRASGLKEKDLIGMPWRVALALRADGWWLRQDIVWEKPNPMPESAADRCTRAHEYFFMLSRCKRYYYDQEAIAEPAIGDVYRDAFVANGISGSGIGDGLRNKRSVWTVASEPYPGSHFAVFPPALVRPAILAGCPQGGVVLDPFAGSGTVGAEAALLDRDAILIEISASYVDMIKTRLAQPGFLAPMVEVVKPMQRLERLRLE